MGQYNKVQYFCGTSRDNFFYKILYNRVLLEQLVVAWALQFNLGHWDKSLLPPPTQHFFFACQAHVTHARRKEWRIWRRPAIDLFEMDSLHASCSLWFTDDESDEEEAASFESDDSWEPGLLFCIFFFIGNSNEVSPLSVSSKSRDLWSLLSVYKSHIHMPSQTHVFCSQKTLMCTKND